MNVFGCFVIFVFILLVLCCGALLFGFCGLYCGVGGFRIIVYCVLFGLVVLVCVVHLVCLLPWICFLGSLLARLVFCCW